MKKKAWAIIFAAILLVSCTALPVFSWILLDENFDNFPVGTKDIVYIDNPFYPTQLLGGIVWDFPLAPSPPNVYVNLNPEIIFQHTPLA